MKKNCTPRRTGPIRLLIADQNRMNCHLIIGALRRRRDISIVACATQSQEVLSRADREQPDVALISAELEDGSLAGFTITRELRAAHPGLRTILILGSVDNGWIIDAFRAGAKGVFSRQDSPTLLCKCIKAVHQGQIWAKSDQLEPVLEAFARLAPPRMMELNTKLVLSKRERQVAELVAEGFSNREISKNLRLSEHTVKNYLFHIFEKLGMSSRVELVLYVHETGKAPKDDPSAA